MHTYSGYTMHTQVGQNTQVNANHWAINLCVRRSHENRGRHNWHEQKQSKSFWHGKATRHKVRDWISSPNDAAVSILDQKWLMALVILFKNFTQGQGQPTIYKIRKNDKAEPSSPCSWWPLCNLSQGSRQHRGLLAEAPFRLDGSYGSSGRTVGINDCLLNHATYWTNLVFLAEDKNQLKHTAA